MLRLIRFRLPAVDGDAFEAFARNVAVPHAREGGALAIVVGRREDGRDRRYAVVSRYPGFEVLQEVIGPDLEHPQFLDQWRHRLIDPVPEHYEAVDLEPRSPDARDPSLLRIYTARIAEADATAYYDFMRNVAWPSIRGRETLAAALFGRRVEDAEHALAFVTMWAVDPAAAAASSTDGPPQPYELVRDEQIEHYDVVAASFGAGSAVTE